MRYFHSILLVSHSNLCLYFFFSLSKIKDKIIEKAKKTGWKSIIEQHKKLFVDMSENEVVETAKRYIKCDCCRKDLLIPSESISCN